MVKTSDKKSWQAFLPEMTSASEADVLVRQDHTLQGDPFLLTGTLRHKEVDQRETLAGQGCGNQKICEHRDCPFKCIVDSEGQGPLCMLGISETEVRVAH